MTRTLSTNNQTHTIKPITDFAWLLKVDFSVLLLLSSREQIVYESNTYFAANLEVEIQPPNATVRIYNSGLGFSDRMISEGTGKAATLTLVYGPGPFSSGDGDVFFDGVSGPIEISEKFIEMQFLPTEPFISPLHRATNQIFSHLPPDGMQIQTRSGLYIIRRNN